MIAPAPAVTTNVPNIQVRDMGTCEYLPVLRLMQAFTEQRGAATPDEIWWLQHPPVYTQGLSCKQSTLGPSDIEIVACDRGGQITYHGPGQLVVYVLYDLKRRGEGPKWLVHVLEQAVLDLLFEHGIKGERRAGAPGVYVEDRKLAALGLRVRRGASYHGLSLNVDMDLTPFSNIDPCGFAGLQATQLKDLGVSLALPEVAHRLIEHLCSLSN